MDIVANTFAIYLAGFETTSTTLSFCLYELALNQNIQEKVRAEIQQIKEQNGGLNYNSLQEMTYVDAVIAETLRKYPPAPSVTRQSTEDYLIPETNTRLPSGTKIIIPIWSIHHDGRHYPNPEVFDPERFTGENKFKQRNGVYLPFGDGPRICFGDGCPTKSCDWIRPSNGSDLPPIVEAGKDTYGNILYAGRAFYGGDLLPAAVLLSKEVALVSFASFEHKVYDYETY
ncbi:hypothetical protein V9T40_001186 [Parthenolecanium corni]|uniref:Cytochrome P450 n=1 Tax=Parthenolecanium corni TaxID=536013 RepID=A0AAN9Y160_9HEMI